MFKNIEWKYTNGITFVFLLGTLLVSVTAVPWFLWTHDLDTMTICLFWFYTMATGFSVTLGYHRMFSHITFKGTWPVKVFTLLFGATSFENSALDWSYEHRLHHKYVDHEKDPYNIRDGFFHAHIGWMLFKKKPKLPMDNVKDLEKDPLVMFQHRWVQYIAVFMSFILPPILGWFNNGSEGALACLLIVGAARVVLVQHSTFCINSFAHYVGNRPYSTASTARDSWFTALLTFGEGYHNYHHTFQHDYRNGVKPWQFDPTKWIIWTLSKVGLVSNLRRVPEAKIVLAEMMVARDQIDSTLDIYIADISKVSSAKLKECAEKAQEISDNLMNSCKEIQDATRNKIEISKDLITQWRKEIHEVGSYLKQIEVLGKKPELA